jgi:TRAP-type uncharacterized transport system substrate-binding protein
VSVDLPNGGTFVTAMTVFERLGIRPNYVFIEQRIAYEKLRKGEIDALVAVQGAPSKLITQIKDEKLHFVPIDYAKPLQDDYLPAQLKAEDYPSLLAPGERIDTIAVPAVLAAYNWPQKSERYRKVAHFVEAFFSKFKEFQQPPFHPKWREIAPQAPLKGWTRFPAAQALLDGAAPTTELRERFDRFVVEGGPKAAGASAKSTDDALFNEFVKWKKRGRTSVTKPAAE